MESGANNVFIQLELIRNQGNYQLRIMSEHKILFYKLILYIS
jgi:hypothetical protein